MAQGGRGADAQCRCVPGWTGWPRASRHQGVVAFVEETAPVSSLEEVLEDATEPPLLLVLDGVQDPA